MAVEPDELAETECKTASSWGGEGKLLFAFNGRATRNFLVLLCVMEFILFIPDSPDDTVFCGAMVLIIV